MGLTTGISSSNLGGQLWERGPHDDAGVLGKGVVPMERVERQGNGLGLRSAVRFDVFELDAKRCELRRRGVPVDLPPQALKVLGILAERPDELVTRKEIREALWPGQAYGDFDSRLNFAVRKLREALGEDAEQPRYVQTVRNAGYRFIAPVRGGEASSNFRSNLQGLPVSRPRMVVGGGFRLGSGASMLVFTTAVVIAAGAVLLLRQGNLGQSGRVEAKAAGATTNVEYEPRIDSVSEILPAVRQRIVIRGRGFGLHVPYVHTDSPYLAIRDLSAHWAAGRIVPHNWDEVMVDVEIWTDSQIVIGGFSGDSGKGGWRLAAGDELEIAVWNPQSGVGPGLLRVAVTSAGGAMK